MAAERIEGVREADFVYPAGTGVVTYDHTVTSLDAILEELRRATGFEATPRGRKEPLVGGAPH